MIGIVVPESKREVVSEFFELFKTPAETHEEEREYDVVLVCGSSVPKNINCRLLVVYGAVETPFDLARGCAVRTIERTCRVERKEAEFFLYQGCATFDARDLGLQECSTQRTFAYVGEDDGTPFIRIGYDLFSEVSHLLSDGQPAENAQCPSLERHIELLRDIIVGFSIPVAEIPPAPLGYDFAVCLTHDVDHPSIRLHGCDHTTLGFLYRGLVGSIQRLIKGRITIAQVVANVSAVLRLPLVLLGWSKDIWATFQRYLQIERGLGATYFFITRKADPGRLREGSAPSKRASKYGVSDVRTDVMELISQGAEVGVHGIDAWCSANSGRTERADLAAITGTKDIGIRMHWLYYDSASPGKLEEAGYAYDSTFGYNNTVGHRAGTMQAFRPQGAKALIEVPLHIMDTALFYPAHLDHSFANAWKIVAPLIDDVVRFGGILTVNWHDRSIAPERLWEPFYAKMLCELKSRAAWFPTVGNAVTWVRKRRSAAFERPERDVTSWQVRATAQPSPDHTPGLRLRAHRPTPFDGDYQSWSCKPARDFCEVALESFATVSLELETLSPENHQSADVCHA